MRRKQSASEQPGVNRLGGERGSVLLLSMRKLSRLVAFCTLYEFEDVVARVTDADRIDVVDEATLELSRRTYKVLRGVTRSRALARTVASRPFRARLKRDYDLFLPIFNYPHELYALRSVPDWRERCRFAACFVSEVWVHLLPEYLLELLAEFDHVFIGMQHCVADVQRIIGRPCSYLPVATDVLRFSPGANPSPRVIDVCNIGRRSQTTHAALIDLARARRLFYYYDTFAAGGGSERHQRTFRVHDHEEHRLLLANLLQRSRYYIANRSRVNQPDYTGAHEEISYRFYEGAAAGTVMLGVAPENPGFQEQFNWPDAVIPVPFDCPEIGQVIARLDREPDRLASIARENAAQAARRHDWVHRLGQVFDVLGLSKTEAMLERERRLTSRSTSNRYAVA